MCAAQEKPLRTLPFTSSAAVSRPPCAREVSLQVPQLPFNTIVGQAPSDTTVTFRDVDVGRLQSD